MTLPSQADFNYRLSVVEQRVNELKQPGQKVEIVAVTKAHPVDAVRLAAGAGLAIGENYAQELLAKEDEVRRLIDSAALRVHFIGQLQTNKVRQIAHIVDVFETLDRSSLVDELVKRKPGADVFVQVNATADVGRGGCSWSQLDQLVEQARNAELNVRGLMTVGIANDVGATREAFAELASEAARLQIDELSMGMSQDWEIAVAEGATQIRLGSALFGERNQ